MISIFYALNQEEKDLVLYARWRKSIKKVKRKTRGIFQPEIWEAAKAGNEEAMQTIFNLLPI